MRTPLPGTPEEEEEEEEEEMMGTPAVDIVDIYESIRERHRHDSERSSCSTLEQNDIEAVEVLVCMSSWGQRSQKGDLLKIRPLTPVSDSGDFPVHTEPTSELSKEYNFLSTLCMTPPYSPDFIEPFLCITALVTASHLLKIWDHQGQHVCLRCHSSSGRFSHRSPAVCPENGEAVEPEGSQSRAAPSSAL
ncbi:hypothetical protein JRQ81_009089 [Phrynocephalus forsythii]|uniref:Uncharacterized protein n=1 Tax=Phrynocephalus forsythii TaxID=171643 RepID=A0A9Q0Y525_9SAUR|nr:hypothetical protein JRQ81_009089 [Phrynocephalus forsythii]